VAALARSTGLGPSPVVVNVSVSLIVKLPREVVLDAVVGDFGSTCYLRRIDRTGFHSSISTLQHFGII